MILGRFLQRIAGRKVLPNHSHCTSLDEDADEEFQVEHLQFVGKPHSKSLPCIREDEDENENKLNKKISVKKSARTLTTASTSSTDDRSNISRHMPPKRMPDLCGQFKGRIMNVDRLLCAVERVEEVIWSSVLMDDVSETNVIQFNTLEPSTVNPPDVRSPSSILPVEALLKALIMVKETGGLVRENSQSTQYANEIIAKLDTLPCDEDARRFLTAILKAVVGNNDEDEDSFLDEEILNRLSSVLRFHLRFAFNPVKRFSPIILAKSARPFESIVDAKDVPRMELNVAALFHNALLLVCEGLGEKYDIHDALRYRSAKKYVGSVLACAKRIENVDEKRRKSWQSAQRWAGDLARLYPDEMCELALLANLPKLNELITQTNQASDLELLEIHRASLKDKRGASQDLRALRASMTGLCGRNGCFPDIMFILDG